MIMGKNRKAFLNFLLITFFGKPFLHLFEQLWNQHKICFFDNPNLLSKYNFLALTTTFFKLWSQKRSERLKVYFLKYI
jgi:hypothetical protein